MARGEATRPLRRKRVVEPIRAHQAAEQRRPRAKNVAPRPRARPSPDERADQAPIRLSVLTEARGCGVERTVEEDCIAVERMARCERRVDPLDVEVAKDRRS